MMKKFIFKNKIAITACVLVLAFGVGYWVLSSPGITTVGEDITAGGRVCDGFGNCLDTVSGGGFTPEDMDTIGRGNDSAGSTTFPNGLIMKWGKTTRTGVSTTVTFDTAFPNACFQTIVCGGVNNDSYDVAAYAISRSDFKIRAHDPSVTTLRWFAMGR